MTTFVDAMDQLEGVNITRLGENNHSEYTWSVFQKDKIVQLYYQINRCSEEESKSMADIFYNLLVTYKNDTKMTELLYRLVVFTRDMIDGKGERQISFDFIYQVSRIDQNAARTMIRYMVSGDKLGSEGKQHQYGCWRDLKILWSNYDWKAINFDSSFMISLMNDQVKSDSNASKLSLVAKWIPREKSKYKRMFYVLAEDYYSEYLSTPVTKDQMDKAKKKVYMNYRKMISSLNMQLDTVQIKQCDKNYSSIDYDHVTSITMAKQKNAFLNTYKNGDLRSTEEDRVSGAQNIQKFISDKVSSGKTIQGKRVSIYDFIKDAYYYNSTKSDLLDHHKSLLNSQWTDAGKSLGSLENFVAMVDTSASMECDDYTPLYNAIGLGCRIAEKSKLGRRVLTFNSDPSWVNLEGKDTLCEMVDEIKTSNSKGYGTNFTKALDLILDSVVKARLTNDVVKNIALVILSDMQISGQTDGRYNYNETIDESMWNLIKRKYADAGNKIHGIPYDVPCMVFWNLRTTSGFPTLTDQIGASMMSGSNPTLINSFCNIGLTELRNMTPRDNMVKSLMNDRYNIFTA